MNPYLGIAVQELNKGPPGASFHITFLNSFPPNRHNSNATMYEFHDVHFFPMMLDRNYACND